MSVLVVGVSHRTAPVPLLEKVTVGIEPGSTAVLDELRAVGPVNEAVVLSTCNRVEVYADTEGFHAGVDAITDLLAQRSGVPMEELEDHLYVHWEGQAVQHLFTVAAGLDSMVVGESQILGQLRQAYAGARDGSAGRTLHELFQKALNVGKRVHTDTGIDEAGQSLVTVALDRAAGAVGDLTGRPVLVVGAGSMGALAGATLKRGGAGRIVVANRTPEGARRLATALDGEGTGLVDLAARLAEADVVVSCTGATGVVVTREDVELALARRGGRPLALLDLALPHDVDPSVADLPGVTLVTLSSLQEVLAGTGTGEDVEAARRIVTEGVAQFLSWQKASRVAPTVVALRSRAEQLVEAEVARLEGRLPELDERARQEVAASLKRVVGALLHTPTVRVKELAEAPAGLSYAEALRELFGLDRTAPAAVASGPVALEPGEPA
ncbi:MAG TPA: glutamyl-tRNA reductase [Mycobacteriales bacterium]|nr:glutamyl-tRNA reductase [Mycobacteriales bacterium]